VLTKAQEAKSASARTKARDQAVVICRAFMDRLRAFRVLDPACGSGNFLYLALLALKDLEHRASIEAEAMGLQREFPQIGPASVKGIEINHYAAELARVSVWIGEIQWMRRVPGGADLVCYWFEKARALISSNRLARAGLVATNSIRGGLINRSVLDHIHQDLEIFDAWADEPWVIDGAAVRVSIVSFGLSKSSEQRLDGKPVDTINADLSSKATDVTKTARLRENQDVAFQGTISYGPFEIRGEEARSLIQMPLNPNGRSNADVVRPWSNGQDITKRSQDFWIIFFPDGTTERQAALYEAPFNLIEKVVKPYRAAKNNSDLNRYWWRLWRSRPDLLSALKHMGRQIVTPRVSKHRLFVWRPLQVIADSATVSIARDDDTTFGILHSRFHEAWALRLGTSLEDRPRYTPSTTFETFPFPEGLTPNIPTSAYASDPRAVNIADAAKRLNELREAWLNPSDLVKRVPEVVAGFPDRILPVDDKAAAILKKRTLTNLYNERPAWLANAHRDLDAAVAAAYGWPSDISDDDALARLFALNQSRTPVAGDAE
jgi:type II restriction/modification system DNA methylase subunit YeeA